MKKADFMFYPKGSAIEILNSTTEKRENLPRPSNINHSDHSNIATSFR